MGYYGGSVLFPLWSDLYIRFFSFSVKKWNEGSCVHPSAACSDSNLSTEAFRMCQLWRNGINQVIAGGQNNVRAKFLIPESFWCPLVSLALFWVILGAAVRWARWGLARLSWICIYIYCLEKWKPDEWSVFIFSRISDAVCKSLCTPGHENSLETLPSGLCCCTVIAFIKKWEHAFLFPIESQAVAVDWNCQAVLLPVTDLNTERLWCCVCTSALSIFIIDIRLYKWLSQDSSKKK